MKPPPINARRNSANYTKDPCALLRLTISKFLLEFFVFRNKSETFNILLGINGAQSNPDVSKQRDKRSKENSEEKTERPYIFERTEKKHLFLFSVEFYHYNKISVRFASNGQRMNFKASIDRTFCVKTSSLIST